MTQKMNPYYETKLGRLYCGDCLEILPELEQVDLAVTSPPYDNLRDYKGYVFDFENTAKKLYRITKNGGVVVWIVKDAFVDGSETGTSFKQALYFKDIGFNLTTMLYVKNSGLRTGSLKFYQDNFEYVFILTKGKTHTFNPIKDKKNIYVRQSGIISKRQKDGSLKKTSMRKQASKIGQRDNVWIYSPGYMKSAKDKIAYKHPAIFPEELAQDHILSWSNENDIVLDIMSGSGTTLKMAERLNRKWIGIEISEEYCEISARRIEKEASQLKLFRK